MNKVPVCSFSDAKIRHLFGGLRLTATYCDLAERKMLIVRGEKFFIIFCFLFDNLDYHWHHGYKVK
jgi:hypothetical protein